MVLPYTLVDGGGSGEAGTDSGLNLTMYAIPITVSSVEIRVERFGQTKNPTNYKVRYTKLKNADGTVVVTPNTDLSYPVEDPEVDTVFTVYNLEEGATYAMQIRAETSPTNYGDWDGQIVVMTITRFNGKVIGSGPLPQQLTSPKGFLTITGPSTKNKNQFAVATKTFNNIKTATYQTQPLTWDVGLMVQQTKKYNPSFYSFGTSLFFTGNIDQINQSAGIGVFTNTEGTEGYFILVDNTAFAASVGRKTIRIVKVQGGKIYKLKDSQRTTDSTFEGIYGGVQYDIDVKVKIKDYTVTLNIYINGFRISAIDVNEYSASSGTNKIVEPTQNVSLMCSQGTVLFDYVYATNIDEPTYKNLSYQLNLYRGQFSNDLLNSLYGDLVYVGNNEQDLYQSNKKAVEEFGTVAREIIKANTKFQSRPSMPIKWGVGNNRFAQILSSKMSNFGGEAYVLNNSSVTIPLSDNNVTSLYILGNTLAPSGQLEYSTDEEQTYTTKEPVVFESKWLQNISDVESLANWIKANVINKGKIVNMTIFGNPLISVGDIVTINYPYHGFAGTEKFIVTNVNHTYSEGLETSISCRLIAS